MRDPESQSKALRWYYNHRAECLERQSEYREKMSDAARDALRQYRRRYYEAHRERETARARERRKAMKAQHTALVAELLAGVPKPTWLAEARIMEKLG